MDIWELSLLFVLWFKPPGHQISCSFGEPGATEKYIIQKEPKGIPIWTSTFQAKYCSQSCCGSSFFLSSSYWRPEGPTGSLQIFSRVLEVSESSKIGTALPLRSCNPLCGRRQTGSSRCSFPSAQLGEAVKSSEPEAIQRDPSPLAESRATFRNLWVSNGQTVSLVAAFFVRRKRRSWPKVGLWSRRKSHVAPVGLHSASQNMETMWMWSCLAANHQWIPE